MQNVWTSIKKLKEVSPLFLEKLISDKESLCRSNYENFLEYLQDGILANNFYKRPFSLLFRATINFLQTFQVLI